MSPMWQDSVPGGKGLYIAPLTGSVSAYVSGDSLGGKITLENMMETAIAKGAWQSLFIVGKSDKKPTGNILIFDKDPTAATLTDNAAVVLSTNNVDVIARVAVGAGDYTTINGTAYATIDGLGKIVQANGNDRNLFAVFVLDAAITLASVGDIILKFGVL